MVLTSLLSSLRSSRARKSFVLLLAAASAFVLADAAYSQPPQGGRGAGAQGGRPNMGGDRGGRGGMSGGRPNMGGDRGGRGGMPGGRPGMDGNWGGRGNMPGGEAPNGEMQDGQDPNAQGQDGQQAQQQAPERKVSLEDALKNANPTTAIPLNQDDFTAMDGVKLQGVYYKGKGDTETPVVVLLHDLNGKREEWEPMAQQLAQLGYAVLLPDLRGGGSGARQMGPGNNNPPNDRPQAQQQVSQQDIMAMIELDRQVWFNFLAYVNNNEYCNIKKTILVGSGFGAALAASWAKSDWTSKDLVSQNVCGLVLLSPDVENDMNAKKFNALSSLEALRKRVKFPTVGALIFVGQLEKDKFEAAKEIQQKFGGKVADETTPMEDRACPLVALTTDQQADSLLKIDTFGVPKTIAQYVQVRMKKLPKKHAKWEKLEEKKSSRR